MKKSYGKDRLLLIGSLALLSIDTELARNGMKREDD
jgi:hypothetical protein